MKYRRYLLHAVLKGEEVNAKHNGNMQMMLGFCNSVHILTKQGLKGSHLRRREAKDRGIILHASDNAKHQC